jgi:hypothetical protein
MHMNDAALRAAVERRRKQLKRPDEGRVPPQTWEYLDGRGIVEDARTRDFDVDVIEYLVKEIDELAAAAPGGAGGRTRRDEGYDDAERYGESGDAEGRTLSVDLSDYEYERNKAYAEIMARLVNQAGEVVDVRRNYLNGEVLTPDQAYTFIESSAARYFTPVIFRKLGIPTRRHKIELLAESYSDPLSAGIDYSVTLHVTPPGETKTVRYAPDNTPAPHDRKVDYTYSKMRESLGSGGSQKRVMRFLRALSYRGPDGLRKRAHVWPGSLLDELRDCSIQLAARLSKSYEWTEEDMVWLVLTGEVPEPRTLTMRVHFGGGGARIDMAMPPWISAETVEKNYRNAQRRILIKSNHALSLRRLAVLRFVEAATRIDGKRPPFPQLLTEWNEQHPAWRYEDYRGLAQANRETLRQVALSPFRIPIR